MKNKIIQILKNIEEVKKEFREWCANKDIPLDERWSLFVSSTLGIDKIYIENFDCKLGRDYQEDLEYKYETHTVENILDFASDNDYTKEEIIIFKEKVLEKFIYSFKFDW